MTNTVLIKRSGTANSIPGAGNLQSGELAINYADGNLFYKNSSNVVTLLTSTQFVSVAGNVTGGNLNAAGLSLSGNVVSAINSTSNITTTGNISGGNILGGANVNATTHTGTTVSVTGNITGGNLNAAGLSLSGNVVSAINSASNITTTANVSGSYFIGNGSALTGITASAGAAITNGTSNVTVAANSNVTVGVTGNTVATFASTGLILPGIMSATGNITGGNINTPGNIVSNRAVAFAISTAPSTSMYLYGGVAGSGSDAGHIYLIAGNSTTSGNPGDIILQPGANVALGVGSGCVRVNVVTVSTSTSTGALVVSGGMGIAGNIYANALISATGNITGGNLITSAAISAASVSASGNITGGNILGGANVNATTHTGTTVSVTGNITGGNLNAAGLSLSSNVVSALVSAANITTTANISGGFILGNGSQLTGIATGSSTKISNGTSEANIGTSAGNANITIGGVSNVAVFTTTGLNIAGNISASGNISSGLFFGGGNMGLDTEPVTQTFNFGNLTAGVDTIYALNVVTAPGDAVNGVNIIDYSIANTKLANSIVLTTPNIGAATGAGLTVTGNVNAAGLTGTTASVTGTVFADRITTVSIPQVLNDISNQCDGAKMVFPLTVDQSNITSANITDSKNLQVAINGAVLSPWVNTQTWPWFQTFAGFPLRSPGYQVNATTTSANVTFYRSPAQGSQVVLTIINNSSTAQLRKYPYSATTIALGD